MKNIFRILMAVALLFTASCAKEDISSSIGGGEVEVTFTANLQDLGSRAYGNAEEITTLRYYVFDKDGNPLAGLNTDNTITAAAGTKFFSVPLVLIKGMTYKILFWADNGGDFYTIDPAAGTVTANYTNALANDESRDAFYGVIPAFDPATAKSEDVKVVLKRPFAQLNAITKDFAELEKSGVQLIKSKIVGVIPTTLNVFDGSLGDATQEVTFAFDVIPTDENTTDELTPLSMNYILAPATQKFIADITFSYEGTIDFPNATYTNIPLQRNYKTNIIGKLLTKTTDFEVEIKPGFDTPDQEPEELFMAAVLGGEVTLTEDVVLTQPLNVESKMTINLNGKKISGAIHKSVGAIIKNKGTLTIKGGTISSTANNGGSAVQNNGILVVEDATLNGAPNADGDWPSYTVNNTGKMTISNTKITSYHGAVASYGDGAVVTLNDSEIDMNGIPGFTSHGMYTYNNGKIVVNGGTYANKATDQASSGASVINGAIEVNAGTFSGRIENYYGTPVLKGGNYSVKPNANFIAAGYKAIEKDGLYYVVSNDTDNIVANKTDLQNVLKDAVAAGTTDVVIDAAGADLGNLNYGFSNGNVPTGTTVTIRNAKVTEASKWNYVNGTIIFENCEFTAGLYSIHFDDADGVGDVIFKKCKLVGWVPFGGIHSVSFEDCHLTGNGSYALIRSYANLSLKNCVIDTTLANHTDEYPDGIQVIDAELTEENVTYIDNHTAYLQNALKAGKNVVLSSDLTINEGEMITAPYGNKMAVSQNGGVFDGNGKTISCTIGGDNYAIMTAGGTIKNLTIDNGFRGIVIMNAKQTINIDNVVSSGDGVCYALNTAEGDSTQDLVVTNSTFNGWSSWALLKSASFTNCTFGQGTYYTNVSGRLAKPYVNTLFDGCEFCSKYYIDLSSLGNGQKVTLKNCTVNGVKLTAQNFASLVAPESSCGDGQISIELKDGTYMTAENVADYIVIE